MRDVTSEGADGGRTPDRWSAACSSHSSGVAILLLSTSDRPLMRVQGGDDPAGALPSSLDSSSWTEIRSPSRIAVRCASSTRSLRERTSPSGRYPKQGGRTWRDPDRRGAAASAAPTTSWFSPTKL